MASIAKGNRGGKVLVSDGYRFQKNKVLENKIHWRCWKKDCRSPLQTNVFDFDDERANIVILQVRLSYFQIKKMLRVLYTCCFPFPNAQTFQWYSVKDGMFYSTWLRLVE